MTQNTILSALTARKSVRVFTGDPITADERGAILHAAFQAPTAGNQQLYTILDITDPALKATLADLCDHQPFIANAPLVLVFLADCRRWLNAYHAAGIEDVRFDAGYGRHLHRRAERRHRRGIYGHRQLLHWRRHRERRGHAGRAAPAGFCGARLYAGVWPPDRTAAAPPQARPLCRGRTYRDRTPDELRADFTARAAANGQPDYDFDKAVTAFCNRKYASDFSQEMTRSAEIYWKEFE